MNNNLRPPALASLHRQLGAELIPLPVAAPEEGLLVPADYGDVAAEYQALTSGCGVIDRCWAAALELTGADRQRFLNGQVTCDLKPLTPGQGTYGFFTTAKGRVHADVAVLAGPEELWLEVPALRAEALREHLQRYIIADRVEIRSRPELAITLAGPRAAELVPGAPAEPWAHGRVTVHGVEARAVCQEGLGVPAITLWLPPEAAGELIPALLEMPLDSGERPRPVGYRALDARRVEAGIPWFGRDFAADNFPQETGLEQAVSYTKGCYLGQEVVARLHYRGQVSRQVRGLRFDGPPPQAGTALLLDDREVGAVSSALRSPALGQSIGLGVIQRRGFAPGTQLQLAGGGTAVVVELPFSLG